MKRSALLSLVSYTLVGLAVNAQEPSAPSRGPDGGTRYHVSGVEVLEIAGKPFSAESTIDWTHTMEDGSVVTTHLHSRLARDSQGRVYREGHKFGAPDTPGSATLIETSVYDPTARTRTTCVLSTHHCIVISDRPRTAFTTMPVGPFDKGTRFLTRDNLGADVLNGLPVTGTRETISINPGAIGNDRTLVTTREFWYSPDIENNLAVTRKDPREGTQAIHLSELSRSEPDASLFQPPAGFVVQDQRVVRSLPVQR